MPDNSENPRDVGNAAILQAIQDSNALLAKLTEQMPDRSGSGKKGDAFEMPETYAGRYTTQQTFQQLANLFKDLGNKRQQSGGLSPGASTPEGIFGTAGKLFDKAAAFTPKASGYADAINKGFIRPAQQYGAIATNLNQIGERQGVSGMGSDVGLGPFGVRMPFNDAFNRGLEMKFQAFQDSLGAGLTIGQASKAQEMTVDAGYKYGTPQYNAMKNTIEGATKINSLIGQDPRTAELIDRSTRFGGASQSDMIASITELNNTIKTSNMSVAQALQGALAYTNLLAKTGGNPAAGMRTFSEMSNITGLPGETSLALQGNGYVQAMQMKSTGLLPWQLGQMNPSQRAALTMQSVNQLSRQLGPLPAASSHMDAAGFMHTVSGQDKQDATIAQLMGVDINVIKNMRKNYGANQKYARASEGFTGYAESAMNIATGHLSESEKVARINQLNNAGGGRGTYGALIGQMKRAGFSQKEMDDVMNTGNKLANQTGTSGARLVAEQAHFRNLQFQKILGEKTGKQEGASDRSKVMFDLTPDAKKILQVSDSKQKKGLAGMGIGSVVGGVIGGAIGSIEPFGGTAVGAMIGSSIGGSIGTTVGEEV